jgi:hypothetical protein
VEARSEPAGFYSFLEVDLSAQRVDTDRISSTVHRDPSPANGLLSIVAFLVMFMLGAVVNSFLSDGGTYPVPDDAATQVLQWRTDNAGTVRLTAVFGALAGLAIIWHGSWLSAVVRERAGSREASLVVFGGGIVAGTFMLFAGMLQWVIESPETLADVPLMRAVDRIIYATSGPGSVVGFLLLVGGAALALRGTALLPSWFTVVGMVAGVVSLLSLALLLPADGSTFGFVSLGRFPSLLWLLATAILLRGRLRRTA